MDEHKSILDLKAQEFELEIEQKRRVVDEELKNKVADVERKESELNHMEEKIRKREQALDKKAEKVKEREKEIELKLKSVKEREKSLRAEEKDLENDKKEVLVEKENLIAEKNELEKIKTDIQNQLETIHKEREQLKVTEDERSEHARLQLELQQEISNCRLQRELLLKETEDLKQERLRFEKEWEELDEKSAEIKKEFEDVAEQRKNFEKLRQSEEERLKNEKLETQSYVHRELEALKVAQKSFAASMEHEKSVLAEKIESEKMNMLHDFEMQKTELETGIQKKQEEMENNLIDRVKAFEENRDRELSNINYLREVARREMEEMKVERLGIEKEKQEISSNKQHLEMQQHGMQKDIEELVCLSKKLKDQREQFLKERQRFIDFVEKQKNCDGCAELIQDFVLSDLQFENTEVVPLPKAAENYVGAVPGTSEKAKGEFSPNVVKVGSPASGGTMSWLRKCTTKIFGLSPKKAELDDAQELHVEGVNMESQGILQNAGNEPELSLGFADDSFDVQGIQSESSIRVIEVGPDHSADERGSLHSHAKGTRKRGRSRPNRTRSVKAVVADAKALLGEDFVEDESQHANGKAEGNSGYINEESRGEPGPPGNKRKRNKGLTSQATTSELDGEHSGHSESVTGERLRKRRQKVAPPVQAPGEKRYNLRRPKTYVIHLPMYTTF